MRLRDLFGGKDAGTAGPSGADLAEPAGHGLPENSSPGRGAAPPTDSVAWCLGQIGDPGARDALETLSRDRNRDIREAAGYALRTLPPGE